MKKLKKLFSIFLICMYVILFVNPTAANAKGTTYVELKDIYFTKANCVVYAEPTYDSTVLTTVKANLPVTVVGYYTNGWYRIDIGLIAYVKMGSLTPAGEFGSVSASDPMGQDAQKVAKELGYTFHYLTLNKEKVIEKDIFNQYVAEKCIVYAKINDDLGVYFKMIYDDPVTSDIDLNYTVTASENSDGSRVIYYEAPEDIELKGTIANFIFKVGYDKIVDNYIKDVDTDEYNLMNSFYTEFLQVSYAPVTCVTDMYIFEEETTMSLSTTRRAKMSDLRKGIKYMEYDEADYRSAITSKLRKDTEYIDYVLKSSSDS